jgi:hypothetical protein
MMLVELVMIIAPGLMPHQHLRSTTAHRRRRHMHQVLLGRALAQ